MKPQDTERSNPIARAFSRFFERGRVGGKARDPEPQVVSAPPGVSAASSQRTATAPGAPGFAGAPVAGASPFPPSTAPAAARAGTTAPTPTATPSASIRTHTVQKGDTLSAIAQTLYGRADRWQLIYQANRDKLDDPDRIFPGQVLVIPDAPSVH